MSDPQVQEAADQLECDAAVLEGELEGGDTEQDQVGAGSRLVV
jgi:hypothetical protein